MPQYYCDRCRTSRGWVGFHVCFDASKPEPHVRSLPPRKRTPRSETYDGRLSRWENIKLAEKPRNDELIARYNEGDVGVKHLAEIYHLSHDKILRILHDAAAEGRTVVRARGHTLAKGA